MQWYGSVDNRIDEKVKGEEPKVGMGVTEYCWSDRHAYEIIEVIDDRHIVVRAYKCIRIDHNGMSDLQSYRYESNENGTIRKLFRTAKNEWRERIGNRQLGCNRWRVGRTEEYYDYSF